MSSLVVARSRPACSDSTGDDRLPTGPGPRAWVTELGDPAIAFTVSNLKIDKAAGTVTAIVKNDSVSYTGVPWVYAVYFDEKGNPMDTGGCSGGCVPSLLPGQSARLHAGLDFSSSGAATVRIFVSAHWFGPRP
jgi:hypothetical protein